MKKEQWAILLAFLAGCALTNLLGGDMLKSYGILNTYFLNQYSYRMIDGDRLFCCILMERGRMAVTVFLFGHVLSGSVFCLLAKSIAAAEIGFLLTTAVINLGIRGIPVCLAALLPQWIFYFAVLFYYADCRREDAMGTRGAGYAGFGGGILMRGIILWGGMALGVVTECYVNPLILSYFIGKLL